MFWDWLHRLIYWREIRNELREIVDEMSAHERQLVADLDRRIAESFTPAEWAATRERCERRLAEVRSDSW